jgi:hypothetical protein
MHYGVSDDRLEAEGMLVIGMKKWAEVRQDHALGCVHVGIGIPAGSSAHTRLSVQANPTEPNDVRIISIDHAPNDLLQLRPELNVHRLRKVS